MPRDVLLLLSQLPHDAAGGAVRSLRTIVELLAADPSGEFRVSCLGTLATDQQSGIDARGFLAGLGCAVNEKTPASLGARRRPVLECTYRGVEYTLLDTGDRRSNQWATEWGEQYDVLLGEMLHARRPGVVLTMGARPEERRRQKLCRAHGAAVVLGVRQHGYYDREAFEHVDDALMPSEFLVKCYRERIGIVGTAIMPPLLAEDVIAPVHDPVFMTFINPSREKGVMFFARLAESMSVARPDIPFLVVESRGVSGTLLQAGRAGGFDLSRHANIMVSPGAARPRDIYAGTRVLLAPSVWEEPAGRVASEAMVNGIPPIVSDRGGLQEVVGDAGFVRAIPPDLTVQSTSPPGPEAVREWQELIIRLADDEEFYREASARSRAAGSRHLADNLAPRYSEYFRHLEKQPLSLASQSAKTRPSIDPAR